MLIRKYSLKIQEEKTVTANRIRLDDAVSITNKDKSTNNNLQHITQKTKYQATRT